MLYELDHMLLKNVRRLPETHRNSLSLLCYSLVVRTLSRGGGGGGVLGRGRERRRRERALAHMPMQKDTRACSDVDLPQVDLMNFRVEYVRPRIEAAVV